MSRVFAEQPADQTVTADVPLHLTGEAEGVTLGGVLEQTLFSLTIEARPGDIPNAIEADISGLNMGDQLRVSDLMLPAGVETPLDDEELVAQVVAPRVAEEPVTGAVPEEGAEAEAAPAAEGAGEGDSGE